MTPTPHIIAAAAACALAWQEPTQWAFEVNADAGQPAFHVTDANLGEMLDITGGNGEVLFRVGDLADNYAGGSFAVANGYIMLDVPRIGSNGDVRFTQPQIGVVLTSPDGGKWRIRVTNAGTLYTEAEN